jgi:hypothetical protein
VFNRGNSETIWSVSGFSPRTCKQPYDKTQDREYKNEYDPKNLGACGDAALKNIDYSPYVNNKYE